MELNNKASGDSSGTYLKHAAIGAILNGNHDRSSKVFFNGTSVSLSFLIVVPYSLYFCSTHIVGQTHFLKSFLNHRLRVLCILLIIAGR